MIDEPACGNLVNVADKIRFSSISLANSLAFRWFVRSLCSEFRYILEHLSIIIWNTELQFSKIKRKESDNKLPGLCRERYKDEHPSCPA